MYITTHHSLALMMPASSGERKKDLPVGLIRVVYNPGEACR